MKRLLCPGVIITITITVANALETDETDRVVRAAGKGSGIADTEENANSTQSAWMKAKQEHAQDIFSGLTEGDFLKIEKGATVMYGVGILEAWLGPRDFANHYAYEGQANAFEYSLKELVRHSKQQNIDGALNAYITMSQTCVRCHSLVRDSNTSK